MKTFAIFVAVILGVAMAHDTYPALKNAAAVYHKLQHKQEDLNQYARARNSKVGVYDHHGYFHLKKAGHDYGYGYGGYGYGVPYGNGYGYGYNYGYPYGGYGQYNNYHHYDNYEHRPYY